jgi:tetratricopeptide (TPR) repeat protein
MLQLANAEGEKKGFELAPRAPPGQFDLNYFLSEWAKTHDLEPAELSSLVSQWANKVQGDPEASAEQRALAAIAKQQLEQAGDLFADAANAHLAKWKQLQRQEQEVRVQEQEEHRLAIQYYHQSASAHFNAGQFERGIEDCRAGLSAADAKSDPFERESLKFLEALAHSMLAATQAGPDVATHAEQAIAIYRELMASFAWPGKTQQRAVVQFELAMLLRRQTGADRDRTQKLLDDSLETEKEILATNGRDRFPEVWATAQMTFGTLVTLGAGQRDIQGYKKLLQTAAEGEKAAIAILASGTTVNLARQATLGTTLALLAEHSDPEEARELLREANDAFDRVISASSADKSPLFWSWTWAGKAEILQAEAALGRPDEARQLLAKAADYTQTAVNALSRERFPQAWAEREQALGDARAQLAEGSDPEQAGALLASAEQAFSSALSVYTIQQFPAEWASIQQSRCWVLGRRFDMSRPEQSRGLLEEAEQACRSALTIFTREKAPQEWARAQLSLGRAMGERAGMVDPEQRRALLQSAEQAEKKALQVLTPSQSLQLWAESESNLGNVMVEEAGQSGGDQRRKQLADAEAAFRSALTSYTRERVPANWAFTEMNLAHVLTEELDDANPEQDSKRLVEAEQADRNALEMFSKQNFAQQWAQTQVSLGGVLEIRAQRSDVTDSRLKLRNEAAEAFRAGLTIYTRESAPEQWAHAEGSLADALREQAVDGSPDAAKLLAEAENAYKCALQVYTRNQFQELWALNETLLGSALYMKAQRSEAVGDRLKLRNEAAEAFRAGLTIYTRESAPEQWAHAEGSLADVLREQAGDGSPDVAKLLAEAENAYKCALQVYTRDRFPELWAANEANLADVWSNQAGLTGGERGSKLFADAARSYEAAAQIYTREKSPQRWANMHLGAARALANQAQLTEGTPGANLLAEAVQAYDAALQIYTRHEFPYEWLGIQSELGRTLTNQADRSDAEDARKLLDKAIDAEKKALEVVSRDQAPQDWAAVQANMGRALADEAERSDEKTAAALFVQAADAFSSVLDVDPNSLEALFEMISIFQDHLFEFEKAFETSRRYLEQTPGDPSAKLSFLETHLTTSRFHDCVEQSTGIRASLNPDDDLHMLLDVLEASCDLGLDHTREARNTLADLQNELARRTGKPLPPWSFSGSKHFIENCPAFTPYRQKLLDLMSAFESGSLESATHTASGLSNSLGQER